MKPRILFVMLEFPRWADASHWGYAANMGMEPGLRANDVDYFILPATHRYGGKRQFWIDHARDLLQGRTFDQVWFEVVHSAIDENSLDFLSSIAPVRLGFCFESMELLPVEWKNNPEACRVREETLEKRLSVLTHLLTTDELDAKRLENQRRFQAQSFPPGFVIPKQFINDDPPPPQLPFGLFFGALYGERKEWLERPELAAVLRYSANSPEQNTQLPAAFDNLHVEAENLFQRGLISPETLDGYLKCNRVIREECFKLWLEGLRLGAAVVNLPQWGRAYASRVVEGMAAGRPVITREMSDRPMANAAFEDGKEILLYRTSQELAAHLERVIADPTFAREIAIAAQKKLRANHTSEGYFAEVLKWISR